MGLGERFEEVWGRSGMGIYAAVWVRLAAFGSALVHAVHRAPLLDAVPFRPAPNVRFSKAKTK